MVSLTTTNKSVGYALRSLYPGAFASYRGVIFRVTGPSQGPLAGITADMSETMKVFESLRGDEDGKKLYDKVSKKLESHIKEEVGRSIPVKVLHVVVPEKIDLRFDESLDMIYCSDSACGTLDKLSYNKFPPKDRMPGCRKCHQSRVQQAPVWIPQKLGNKQGQALLGDPAAQGIIRNMGVHQIFCYFSKPGNKCSHPQGDGKCVLDFVSKLGSLKMTDPQRPVDSLRKYNPHCPKGLEVPPIPLERLHRTTGYWYKMDFPRESMTVPLQVSAAEPRVIEEDPEVDEVNVALEDVKAVILNDEIVDLKESVFSRLRVLELTYGFRTGNRIGGVSSYYLDGHDNNVIGRVTETQGFVLTLRPEFYKRVDGIKGSKYPEEDLDYLVDVALHSIKHTLLVLCPTYTGFEPDKFFGSYDALGPDRGAKVYVYDTDDGGNGGFAAIMKNRQNFVRMLKEISLRLSCPKRECNLACKQCLFIKNCGNVNRKLNRHLISDLEMFYHD